MSAPRTGAWVGLAVALFALRAEAQDKASADTLFDEGRQLIQAGKTEEACAKFEASLTIMPQLGVRLNLGDCYEKIGRTASAWSSFRAAESTANRTGDQQRAAYATQRMRAIEPTLSRLAIKVESPAPGQEVRRDGGIVPPAMYGSAVPVDPGKREVRASADGHEEWRRTVDVPAGPGTVDVVVPALKRAAVVTGPSSGPVDTGPDPGKGRRIAGLAVGGAGVALVGVSVVFGLGAKSAWADAQEMGCDDEGVCPDQAALDRLKSGRSKALLATILGIGGVAAIGTGVVLYLTAPRRREAVVVAPQVTPGFVGVSVSGGF